jgi:uncharacterized protein YecE (DUF72 family)
VNNTFYRLPERATFARWAAQLPSGFVMAVKMSRYLTHIRRLADPAEPVDRFLDRAGGLGEHLGPVLLQLPPNLGVTVALLDTVLARLCPRVRVVVEPRDASWWSDEVRETLSRHGAALCWVDRLGRPVTPLWRTADFGYLRMHQGRAPSTSYGARAIDSWLHRVAGTWDGTEDVYVYFNNDTGGAAVRDARTMRRRAASVG